MAHPEEPRPDLRPGNGNGNGPPDPGPTPHNPDQDILDQLTLVSFTATPSTVALGISESVTLTWQVTEPVTPGARNIRYTLETGAGDFNVGPAGSQSVQVSTPITFSLVASLRNAQHAWLVSITGLVQPEIAMESNVCLSPDIRQKVLLQLNLQLQKLGVKSKELLPNPKATSICWQQSQEHLGIWFYSAPDDKALQQLPNLLSTRPFALNVSPSAFSRISNSIWQQQLQKSDSRLTLQNLTTSFEPPNRIVLKITGTAHGKVLGVDIDTGFTATYTITFEVFSGRVQIITEQHLDVDTSLVNFIEVLLPPAKPFLDDKVAQGESRLPTIADFGDLIASVLPTDILLPGTAQKLVFTYDQRQVDSGTGILFAGPTPSLQPRQPSVDISGDTDISYPNAGFDDPQNPGFVIGQYSTVPIDLRGPKSVWQSSGRILNSKDDSATIQFHPTVGVLSGTVSVSVTDQDGLNASKTVQVTVHKSRPHGKGGSNF